MSQTGRKCAAMLLAACLVFPAAGQTVPMEADPPPFETVGDAGHLQSDPEALATAHAAYLRKSGLQLERPEQELDLDLGELERLEPAPGWLKAIIRFLEWLAPLFKFLFYAICVLGVLAFLYFLFGEAIRVRLGGSGDARTGIDDDVIQDFRPEAAAARSLLEEADALARAGRFAEAVHLLLFRSIEDLQARLDIGVPRSLTAREIRDLSYLPARARRALGPIIRIVEYSFFGGRDVDATSWKEARASYEQFAFGGEWA